MNRCLEMRILNIVLTNKGINLYDPVKPFSNELYVFINTIISPFLKMVSNPKENEIFAIQQDNDCDQLQLFVISIHYW